MRGRYEHAFILLDNINWSPNDGDYLLDAGCYTGVSTVDLAVKYRDFNVKVIGLDLSLEINSQDTYPKEAEYSKYLFEQINLYGELNISLIEENYTNITVATKRAGLVFFGNNISQDLYDGYLVDSDQIVNRLGSAFLSLRELGVIMIWSETIHLPICIIQKQNGKAVNILTKKVFNKYLKGRYGKGALYIDPNKFKRDSDICNRLINALNTA